MSGHVCALCALVVIAYLVVGLLISSAIALTWQSKTPPEMGIHIFGWPLTILLCVWAVLHDAYTYVTDGLTKIALRDRGPKPLAATKRSFLSRFRIT